MVPIMDVIIAGGGVAGLEALLALHSMAGERVSLRLIAPDPDFSYRPLAVAEPFGMGHAHHVPLKRFAEETGAELVIDAAVGVDDANRQVHLRDGGAQGFDALLLATGGRPVPGVDDATTWWPEGDPDTYGGLLRDIDEGYTKRLAIVVPLGAVWPLPAYELALMTAGEAREMGHDDVQVTVVTPEHTPLALFGEEAGEAVAEELRWGGVEPGPAWLRDGAERPGARAGRRAARRPARVRGAAPPRPGPEGVPADEEGFIRADDDGLVEGCERTWAAGDGVVSPLKFGGLATHQARRAAAAIARLAGADNVPDPGEPVVHGQLLVGQRRRRLRGRGDAEGAPLWWPQGKIAGEYLPRWLAEHGVVRRPARSRRRAGVDVRRTLRAMRGAEAQHLFDLARRLDSSDPAVAALGRRMRELRDR